MAGKLIVIEGTDCSGKETQTKRLIQRLREKNIFADSFSFPNYQSATGKIIAGPVLGRNDYTECLFEENSIQLNPKVASLYYAADRLYNIDKIKLLLENGANVILNRYIYSNMAHQGGKIEDGNKRNEMYSWLDKLEFELLELPKPDIAIFLHMPSKFSKQLTQNRTVYREKNLEHLFKAEKAYMEIAKRYNMFTVECFKNDQLRTIESINDDVYNYIMNKL